MAVDEILEIDFSALTKETAKDLITQTDKIIKKVEKKKKPRRLKKTPQEIQDERIDQRLEKLKKQVAFDLVSGKGKESLKSKLFGKQDFSKGSIGKNIVKFGLNPTGMIGGLLKTGIPGLGAAIAATAIIITILKKFDDLEKRFTDDIRTRLNQERDNEQTARIQAGLAQEITSFGPGITDPRDVYNSYDEFNTNQKRIETDYAIRTTSGVE